MVQHRNSVLKAQEATLRPTSSTCAMRSISTSPTKESIRQSLDALVTDNYLRKIPADPITGSADYVADVPAEPDPSNPSAEPGDLQR